MHHEQGTMLQLLVRWVFRFDTQLEMNDLLALIDEDLPLRQAFAQTFYRLSLAADNEFYCVLFHSASLPVKHQSSIREYATRCGGTLVTDAKIKNALSTYALVRWLGKDNEHVRWDEPAPKPN